MGIQICGNLRNLWIHLFCFLGVLGGWFSLCVLGLRAVAALCVFPVLKHKEVSRADD